MTKLTLNVADLRVTTWPGGESRVLARATFHGPPVRWLGG